MEIWKLGCNWGNGKPFFDDLLRNEKVVLCWQHDFKVGDIVLIAKGFNVIALAKIISDKVQLTVNKEFDYIYDKYHIEPDNGIYYCKTDWVDLQKNDQFAYRVRQGICQVNKKEIIDLTKLLIDKYMNDIIVESLTIKELFDKQQMLTIPEYQRPYVWTPKEINKLLVQFKQHQGRTDEKPLFYLGSIVLHKKDNLLEIIDGQQRLTTLQILSMIKSKSDFGIKYSHPISLKNIKSNHNHFSKNNFEIIDLNNINVTIVVVENEDLAYSFFETLNTGGKRLSGTDILKAHHLRSITKIAERNKYASNWEERQRNLEAVNKLLVKARRIDYLKPQNIPDKFASAENWKNVLTEDFAENIGKEKLDIGYSLVEIEENTHRIISNKYSIRQPLNEGKNYINYLMSFSNEYNSIFDTRNREDFYSKFNNKMIEQIDGTVDLRSFYQLCLLCFVDMFGRTNLLEFTLWLFRHIFSLRLHEQSRIYEATVRNYVDNTKIIERIFHAYNYQEIITYLKEYNTTEIKINGSQVKQRFFNKCSDFFSLDNPSEANFDEKLKVKIDEIIRNHKDEI